MKVQNQGLIHALTYFVLFGNKGIGSLRFTNGMLNRSQQVIRTQPLSVPYFDCYSVIICVPSLV